MGANGRGSSGRSSGTSGEAGGGLQLLPDLAPAGGELRPNWGGSGGNVDGGLVEEDERKEGRLMECRKSKGMGCFYKLTARAVVTDRADGGGGAPVREGARREGRAVLLIMEMLWDKTAKRKGLWNELAACACSVTCRRTVADGVGV